ncbi:MAG: glutaredoxin domain-containing protein [Candidatus Paceibacterota bacterium]
MKVRVFSTPICPYCITLKRFLDEKGIAYESIDVLEDKAAQEEMIEKSNQFSVPVIDIGGEFIVGFDRNKIVEKLGIKE